MFLEALKPWTRLQFVREFTKLGLTKSVGGVLALALSRELTPVVTCIILAGRPSTPRGHSHYTLRMQHREAALTARSRA